jgi:hypothetical protein
VRRSILVAGVAALAGGLIVSSAAPVAGAVTRADRQITLSSQSAAPGSKVVVELNGWPRAALTVSVCGNQATRGTIDCAVTDAQGAEVDAAGFGVTELVVSAPPVPCPCVVRVATTANDLVRTVPFDVVGAPLGPAIPASGGTGASRSLQVTAHVEDARESWPRSWLPLVAGNASRVLVLRLSNVGDKPLTRLQVLASVGRGKDGGEPVPPAKVDELPPGAVRTLRLPVTLSAPTWGDYTVHGTVYGLEGPVRFAARTSNEPWGLLVVAAAILLVVAQMLRRRERRRKREEEVALRSIPLSESSPLVGTGANGSSHAHVYDHASVSADD